MSASQTVRMSVYWNTAHVIYGAPNVHVKTKQHRLLRLRILSFQAARCIRLRSFASIFEYSESLYIGIEGVLAIYARAETQNARKAGVTALSPSVIDVGFNINSIIISFCAGTFHTVRTASSSRTAHGDGDILLLNPIFFLVPYILLIHLTVESTN
ncbi:uncharacterized protein H6S33_011988 [Morchella sextelata]|uniref:uncharacterized protein n=1 Tax=Morchella sextelata TaxID=1174677 RepID=UPI001D044283|nr:uncharacterized protein H6S33_011988 [Morchella sextelata]KAH0610461.1 hypothetical protein H6S33_011988 [Morchella sextelata]